MLNERGSYLTHPLPDGRVLDVFPLTYGRVRLCVSPDAQAQLYTDAW